MTTYNVADHARRALARTQLIQLRHVDRPIELCLAHSRRRVAKQQLAIHIVLQNDTRRALLIRIAVPALHIATHHYQ